MKKVISILLILVMMFAFPVKSFAVEPVGHVHSYYTTDVSVGYVHGGLHIHGFSGWCAIYEQIRVVTMHCNCGADKGTVTTLGYVHETL